MTRPPISHVGAHLASECPTNKVAEVELGDLPRDEVNHLTYMGCRAKGMSQGRGVKGRSQQAAHAASPFALNPLDHLHR